jgi:hypothetical protein
MLNDELSVPVPVARVEQRLQHHVGVQSRRAPAAQIRGLVEAPGLGGRPYIQ